MLSSLVLALILLIALAVSAVFLIGALRLVWPRPTQALHLSEGKVSSAESHSPLYSLLKKALKGDVSDSDEDRVKMSRDTSIFVRRPQVVVYPKDVEDVQALVRTITAARSEGIPASVAARSAGTDMSGGPLSNSIVAVFTKYFTRILEVGDGYAVTEPGVFYRDFEKATLAHGEQILPSYPASRELAAMGGLVNNDSGGERTLEYGKTNAYVEEVEVVLSDGSVATFGPLGREALESKKNLPTLEGRIYAQMHTLIQEHAEVIRRATPLVSKNSAGYALWNVINPATGTFNLAKLITGAQGTLALMTKARLRLIKNQGFRSMVVIFVNDISTLPTIVSRVLPLTPESFESYDDKTFTLALRFLPKLLGRLGFLGALRLGVSFLPEIGMALTGGVPKLVLMAEFSEDSHAEALRKARRAKEALTDMHLSTRLLVDEDASHKYWVVRRESFALLRQNVHGLYASPFIDDFVVPPHSYPSFLPKLYTLLDEYKDKFIYTIAGHIGNGNFHIIPLMDLSRPDVRTVVLELAPKVYDLVLSYGGSTTGEHNDGIIRTPYLTQMFGAQMVELFQKTKDIFDPENIFNPGKKVGGTFDDIKESMITSAS